MSIRTIAAATVALGIGAAASGQATLPRTGPTWTYPRGFGQRWTFPNGFGQRWITPAPGSRLGGHGGSIRYYGRGRYGGLYGGGYYGGHYGHDFGHTPTDRHSGGGHIKFYYGPGQSYSTQVYPRGGTGAVLWYIPAPSGTACWY